jgi:hypothetical protein
VNGDGVSQDPVLGYAYVSRAAAQGLQPAQETLAQLDQLLPLDQRKRAVAIARKMAKAAPAPTSAPVKPAKPVQTATAKAPPVAKPASKAVAAASPAPKPAAPAAPATGAWRIQLGAFSQKGSAEALYRKLSGSLGGHQAFYIPVGNITRLQVGPYSSKAAAQAACASLRGQACFPVAAK